MRAVERVIALHDPFGPFIIRLRRYGRFGTSECVPCPANNSGGATSRDGGLAFILISIVYVLIVGISMKASLAQTVGGRAAMGGARHPPHGQVFKIFLSYQAANSVLLGVQVDWPNEVVNLLRVQSIVGNAVNALYSVDCSLPQSDHSRSFDRLVLLTVSIPVLAFIVPGIISYFVYRTVRGKRQNRLRAPSCSSLLELESALLHRFCPPA